VFNKGVARILGIDTSILLGELCAEFEYWETNNRLTDNEWFYSTIENIQDNTTLSAFQQRRSINKLEEAGIVKTKLIGMPAKKYFSLDINKLNSLMLTNLTTRNEETSLQGMKKLNNKELNNLTTSSEIITQQVVKKLNANNNKDINNNKSNKEKVIKDIEINASKTDATTPPAEPKKATIKKKTFGEFENINLTNEEYLKLVDKFGKAEAEEKIENISSYVASKGDKYKSHYATILAWSKKETKENVQVNKMASFHSATKLSAKDKEALGALGF